MSTDQEKKDTHINIKKLNGLIRVSRILVIILIVKNILFIKPTVYIKDAGCSICQQIVRKKKKERIKDAECSICQQIVRKKKKERMSDTMAPVPDFTRDKDPVQPESQKQGDSKENPEVHAVGVV